MITVIFGTGVNAKSLYRFLGKDKVDYFCDNNKSMVGKVIDEKKIIGYDDLLRIYAEKNVLIFLGVNDINAEIIAEQLEGDGIYDFIDIKFVPGFEKLDKVDIKELYKLENKENRYNYSIQYLKKRIREKDNELKYIKRHLDIKSFKPAIGKLREQQLRSVENAKNTIFFLDNYCPVKCWITGGTLIGKLRHNGFVPWDNDVDFGIIRSDIYKLIEFFKHYSTVIFTNNSDIINETCISYKGKYILTIHSDYLRIYKYNNKTEITLELFPFDFYRDNLTIGEYAQYVSDAFIQKKKISGEKWFEYCYKSIEENGMVSKEPTNKILPGMDSFLYSGLWNIKEFLTYDTIYPLKKVSFEGNDFWCVNKPEIYILHEYEDWESLPRHIYVDEEE